MRGIAGTVAVLSLLASLFFATHQVSSSQGICGSAPRAALHRLPTGGEHTAEELKRASDACARAGRESLAWAGLLLLVGASGIVLFYRGREPSELVAY